MPVVRRAMRRSSPECCRTWGYRCCRHQGAGHPSGAPAASRRNSEPDRRPAAIRSGSTAVWRLSASSISWSCLTGCRTQRLNGMTTAWSRKARMPSSSTVRRKAAHAASSVANGSSHTVEVPLWLTTSSVQPGSSSRRMMWTSTVIPCSVTVPDRPEVTMFGSLACHAPVLAVSPTRCAPAPSSAL